MEERACLICCKKLQDGKVVVVQKGLISLILVSNNRNYRKLWLLLKNLQSTNCAEKNCTRRSSIKASAGPDVGEPAAKVPHLRLRELRFDFKKNYFFVVKR